MKGLTGLVGLLLVAFSGEPAGGQQRRHTPATGLIVGQVVDGNSGSPVAGAVVSLTAGQGSGLTPQPRLLTGSDGRFVYSGLPPARFSIRAAKNGFLDGTYGQTRPGGPSRELTLADGQAAGDVTVRLWRPAAIAGTVLDEAGERQVGLQVRAYRRATIGGRRRFVTAGTGQTDDRGMYRIGRLIPGEYVIGTVTLYASMPLSVPRDVAAAGQGRGMPAAVMAAFRQDGFLQTGDAALAASPGTPPPVSGTALAVYPPTYHPFASAGDAGLVVTVASGEEYEGADLRIAPVPAVRVSGQLAGPEDLVRMTRVTLVSGAAGRDSIEADWLIAITDRAGRFVFPAVPSGHYILRMRQGQSGRGAAQHPDAPMIWTELPLDVGLHDIENLVVLARAGLRVSGRFEFDSQKWTPPGGLNRVSILFEDADAPPGTPPAIARAAADGSFVSPGLPAGRYYVRIPSSPAGWMFVGATANGRDVTDAPFDLSADVQNVVVAFTDRWSGVHGTVTRGGAADPDAFVMVFPTDQESWGSAGGGSRRVRGVRTGPAGEYALNLPPGEYYVAAVPDAAAADWQDPAFMNAASRGATQVAIGFGERKVADLRTRNVP